MKINLMDYVHYDFADINVISARIFDELDHMEPKEFRQFCSENNIFYYARPKEDFSVVQAHALAIECDAEYLLMENLS